jgi:hypothetical protein
MTAPSKRVPQKDAPETDAPRSDARNERLAAALRENLKRRKAQARAQSGEKGQVRTPPGSAKTSG